MFHVQGKQDRNPPAFLTTAMSPEDALPEASFIRDYGIGTLAPGASSNEEVHDCDKWCVVVEGVARVFSGKKEIRMGPGDMVIIPAGEAHRIQALTLLKIVWLSGQRPEA
ncbi:MAG: cupin domain-containing protein [Candidatus Aminicenantales bacterium]